MIKSKHYIELSKPIKASFISDVFFEKDLERIFGKGDKMKCPFCQQELVRHWGMEEPALYCCDNPKCSRGGVATESSWQELIHIQELLDIECTEHEMCHTQMLKTTEKLERTRKALEIAVDALKMIGSGDIIEHSVVGHEDDNKIFIANKALEQITALEQRTTNG